MGKHTEYYLNDFAISNYIGLIDNLNKSIDSLSKTKIDKKKNKITIKRLDSYISEINHILKGYCKHEYIIINNKTCCSKCNVIF